MHLPNGLFVSAVCNVKKDFKSIHHDKFCKHCSITKSLSLISRRSKKHTGFSFFFGMLAEIYMLSSRKSKCSRKTLEEKKLNRMALRNICTGFLLTLKSYYAKWEHGDICIPNALYSPTCKLSFQRKRTWIFRFCVIFAARECRIAWSFLVNSIICSATFRGRFLGLRQHNQHYSSYQTTNSQHEDNS